MKIDDDILNRYIDGELSPAELEEFETLLSSKPELIQKLNSLKMADNMFRQAKGYELPESFTSMIMSNLARKKSSFRTSQNLFFYPIAGIFIVSMIGLAAYFVIGLLTSAEGNTSGGTDYSFYVIKFTNTVIHYILAVFSQKNFSVIGSLTAVTLIVSGYFFYENIKHYKQFRK